MATDASPRRLKGLAERLQVAGLGERVRTAEADAAALPVELGDLFLEQLVQVGMRGRGDVIDFTGVGRRFFDRRLHQRFFQGGQLLHVAH